MLESVNLSLSDEQQAELRLIQLLDLLAYSSEPMLEPFDVDELF
jgi:hypothetical protein